MNTFHKSVAFLGILMSSLLYSCGNASSTPAEKPKADSTTAASTFVNEPLPDNGHARVTDKQGRLRMEGDMKNGQREGIWTSYDVRGKVKSRNEYHGNKLNGITTVFRENGAPMYTGQYHNDKESGLWQFYDASGALNKEVRYDSMGAVINDPGPAPR